MSIRNLKIALVVSLICTSSYAIGAGITDCGQGKSKNGKGCPKKNHGGIGSGSGGSGSNGYTQARTHDWKILFIGGYRQPNVWDTETRIADEKKTRTAQDKRSKQDRDELRRQTQGAKDLAYRERAAKERAGRDLKARDEAATRRAKAERDRTERQAKHIKIQPRPVGTKNNGD
jgi:hypothetical protein